MSQPIIEYSAEHIGKTWNETDHLTLLHAVHEVERTAEAMVRRALEARAKASMNGGKEAA